MTVPAPVTLNHEANYEWADDNSQVRAVCSCGWTGPWRSQRDGDRTDSDIAVHRLGVQRDHDARPHVPPRPGLLSAVDAALAQAEVDNPEAALAFVDEFDFNGVRLEVDWWDWDVSEWHPRFLWACWAILTVVQRYRAASWPSIAEGIQ